MHRHRLGSDRDHAASDPGRPNSDSSQTNSWEHQSVIRLRDLIGHTIDHDWLERRTGRDQSTSVSPREDVGPQGFSLTGRVRQLHDDRTLTLGSHRLDDVLGEGTGLGGAADKDRRVDVSYHVTERVLVWAIEGPAFQLLFTAGEGLLKVAQT
ncbi:MAG: hypothetical protein HW422_1455 [Cutibacterium acnes]|nr:hypothetical protein [Cutibacterium acnes]